MTRTDTHTPPDLVFSATNPLLTHRLTRGLTQQRFAMVLRTSKTTVQFAEKGLFSSPPIPYRHFLTPQDHFCYQRFREIKRTTNFHSTHYQRNCTPTSCRGLNFDPRNWSEITNLEQLLKHLNLTLFQFADVICVTPSELFRLTSPSTSRRRIGSNLQQAFLQIGAPPNFLINIYWTPLSEVKDA